MSHSVLLVEPVVQELRVPAGIAGPAELTFVLTHLHPDHVGGLDEVAARSPGATIPSGSCAGSSTVSMEAFEVTTSVDPPPFVNVR